MKTLYKSLLAFVAWVMLSVSALAVDENDGIMLISDKGTLIRTAISQIPTLGRNTQGVKVISPKDGEKLIEGVRIPPEEEEE